jgi:hypothetical protein
MLNPINQLRNAVGLFGITIASGLSAQTSQALDFVNIHQFMIDTIAVPCGSGAQAKNHAVMVSDRTPWTLSTGFRTELDAVRSGIAGAWVEKESWKMFAPGTGDYDVHRVWMSSNLCSHVPVASNATFVVNGQTVNALQFLTAQAGWRDEGPMFAAKRALRVKHRGEFYGYVCPTGTRPLYAAYNNGFNRTAPRYDQTPMDYRFNDGNHFFFTSFQRWNDVRKLSGWEIGQIDSDDERGLEPSAEPFCIPADTQALWSVANLSPDTPNVPVRSDRYVSRYSINPVSVNVSERKDIAVNGSVSALAIDQDRSIAYLGHAQGGFSALSGTTPTIRGISANNFTGKALQILERDGALVAGSANRIVLIDSITEENTFVGGPPGNFGTVAGNYRIGDLMFQGSNFLLSVGVGSRPAAQVAAYNLRSRRFAGEGTSDQTYGDFDNLQMAYDPRSKLLWIVSPSRGTMNAWNFEAGDEARRLSLALPVFSGSGVTDLVLDTARNKIYFSVANFERNWATPSAAVPDGSVMELDLASYQVTRQVSVGKIPVSLAFLPGDRPMLAVSNSWNPAPTANPTFLSPQNEGSISLIDLSSFSEVGRIQTQPNPRLLDVEIKR